jgi:hypothetical protein
MSTGRSAAALLVAVLLAGCATADLAPPPEPADPAAGNSQAARDLGAFALDMGLILGLSLWP